MKKFTLVMSAILVAALLAISAVAAPVEFEADTDKSFDIAYTGTEGQYYAIVIVEGLVEEGDAPSITEDSIQYIDQQTADENGAVSFEDVLLKVDGTQATVFLGGSDLDEAVLLGWVNKTVEETTFTVNGTVTSDSDLSEATVTLTSTVDTTKVFAVNTVSGAYTITVPADTYEFVVTKAKHLSYTKSALAVNEDTGNVTKDVTVYGGDLDESGCVDFDDLMLIVNNYNSDVEAGDFNEDGAVDFDDLSMVLNNYNAESVVEE